MSEATTAKSNNRKRLVLILVAAIVALALILGGILLFTLGGNEAEPTDPVSTKNPNTSYNDPTDPPELTGVWHCICGSKTETHLTGCNGEAVQWTEWTSTTTLPITSGYYYLSANVKMETSEHVANVTTSENIYLDLNGFNIDSTTRLYRIATGNTDVSLTILDSVGTSVVTMTEHKNGATLILVDSSGTKTVTFYGGTYDGSALVSYGTDGQTSYNGGMMRIGGGTLNIHGGTFIGVSSVQTGGVLYIQNGELNITGGELKNGHAKNGGNVMLRTSTLNMTGGKIYGGVAEGADNSRGGNIFSDKAVINISGDAEVYDGTASYLGDNIFTNQIADFTNTGKVYITNSDANGIYPVPNNPEDTNHMACICGSNTSAHLPGCDGTKYAWRPWTDATQLPSTSGKFYLAVDVNVSATTTVTAAESIYLDLNGHKITSTTRVYAMSAAKVDSSLTLLDTVGTGKVTVTAYGDGGAFAVIGNTGNKVVTIYGGTYDVSGTDASAQQKNGAFFRVGSDTSVLNIHGGTIIGGKAQSGGAVHINGGAMVMTGGVISGGIAENGGNIIVVGGSFTMTGGEIKNGAAVQENKGRGGNIFNNGGTVKISGNAKVYDGTCVTFGENVFSLGQCTTEVKSGCAFFSNKTGDGIYPIPENPEDTSHMSCICGNNSATAADHLPGCDGTKYAWRPWTSTSTLPNESGKYYLAVDVTVDKTIELSGEQAIYIDLNGHTVTTSVRTYLANGVNNKIALTVLDTVGTGKLVTTEDHVENNGVLIAMDQKGEKSVTIYGGTFDASKSKVAKNGLIIFGNNADNTVNIHGGHFIGGNCLTQFGGVLAMSNGTVNMTGGIIEGGTAASGGNILLTNAVFTMTGGEIMNGSAVHETNGRGGNIFNNGGTVNISGDAKVYDGTCVTNGENIFNTGEYTLNVEPGCAFFTEGDGDGIYPAPPVEADPDYMSCICGSNSEDAEDHLGTCDGTQYAWIEWTDTDDLPMDSGKYYLSVDVALTQTVIITDHADIYLDLNGHTVSLDTTENPAIGFYQFAQTGKTCSLTVLDSSEEQTGTIDLNDSTKHGALIVLYDGSKNNNKTFNLYGGTVIGTDVVVSNNNPGAIIRSTDNQTVNIYGGTIYGGRQTTAGKGAGAIYSKDSELNIYGGTITGGRGENGGNIWVENGSFKMTGGTVSGGEATNGGNIYATGDVTFEITGGSVLDGVASGNGANICFEISTEYTIGEDAAVGFTEEGNDATGIYPDPNAVVETRMGCICGSNSDDPADHLEGCDGTKVEWTAWTDANAMPSTSGHYYLDTNVTVSAAMTLSNVDIYIDLNGKTVTANSRIYVSSGTNVTFGLTVLDSDPEGKGEIVFTSSLGNTSGNLATILSAGVKIVTIYGGTFDASAATTDSNGMIINSQHANGAINIHGGHLIGGDVSTKSGGLLYISDGVLTITDGILEGGRAANGGLMQVKAATLNMTGGTIKNGVATATNGRGGNIFVNGGNINISGTAKVIDGTCVTEGDNIFFVTSATYTKNIADGCVGFTDDSKTESGIYPTTYTVEHYQQNLAGDGYLTPVVQSGVVGTSGHLTAAIANTDAGFTAQTFEQKTIASDGSTVVEIYYDRNSFTVTWVVDGQENDVDTYKFGETVTAPADPTVTDYIFTGWDTEIPATMPAENLTITAQFRASNSYEVSFVTNDAGTIDAQIVMENGLVTKPSDPTKTYYTFGGWYSDETCETAWDFENDKVTANMTLYAKWDSVQWTELDEDDVLPSTTGFYKLVGNMTVDSMTLLRGDIDIHIDLNGYTISGGVDGVTGNVSKTECFYLIDNATNPQVTSENAKGFTCVTILDSSDNNTGEIQMTKGCFVYLLADTTHADGVGSKLVINGATIRGCNEATQVGGVIRVYGIDSHLVMNAGTIYGVKASAQNAGSVLVDGYSLFTMTGGVIRDGVAASAGNVLVQGGAHFDMSGGEIFGGHAVGSNGRGGNIFISGTNSTNAASAAIYGTAVVRDGSAASTSVTDSHNIIVLKAAKGLFMDAACEVNYKNCTDAEVTAHVYMTDSDTGEKILTPYIKFMT